MKNILLILLITVGLFAEKKMVVHTDSGDQVFTVQTIDSITFFEDVIVEESQSTNGEWIIIEWDSVWNEYNILDSGTTLPATAKPPYSPWANTVMFGLTFADNEAIGDFDSIIVKYSSNEQLFPSLANFESSDFLFFMSPQLPATNGKIIEQTILYSDFKDDESINNDLVSECINFYIDSDYENSSDSVAYTIYDITIFNREVRQDRDAIISSPSTRNSTSHAEFIRTFRSIQK